MKNFLAFALVAFIGFILYLATKGNPPDLEKMGFAAGAFALTFTSVVLLLAGFISWLDIKERFKDIEMIYGKDIAAKFEKQRRDMHADLDEKFKQQNEKFKKLEDIDAQFKKLINMYDELAQQSKKLAEIAEMLQNNKKEEKAESAAASKKTDHSLIEEKFLKRNFWERESSL